MTNLSTQTNGDQISRSGFYVPGEELPHQATFMTWPATMDAYYDAAHRADTQQVVADIANAIVEFEPVIMLMDPAFQTSARKRLSARVDIWDIPTDDLWCRDAGPVFATDDKGRLAVTHLNFNGWGNRMGHANDGKVARRVADRLGLPFFNNLIVGEGGGVEQDGDGTLIAHESSWVNPNRNPGQNRDQIEDALLTAYGAEHVIWAPGLVDHDITDAHIDGIVRFAGPGKVAIQFDREWHGADTWSVSERETNAAMLAAFDARGRTLDLHYLPVPDTPDWTSTFANYYVFNDAVLASNSPEDWANTEADAVLKRLYPGREVLWLDTELLGKQGGGIHCATQQMPSASAAG